MISVQDALQMVESAASRLGASTLALDDALGYYLASDVVIGVDSPPFDKSLVDGYAVVSSDVAPQRRVIEEVTAGSVPQRTVQAGLATRLMTGAPLPPGADAVVMREDCQLVDEETILL